MRFAGSPPQTMRYQGLPAHFIDRDQERTQLYVGKLPGQFDVETPEGSSAYHITSLEVRKALKWLPHRLWVLMTGRVCLYF